MTQGATVLEHAAGEPPQAPVWIVEDDPAVAQLAVELCEKSGVSGVGFGTTTPYLDALRNGHERPAAVILDWRLERELSSALFMATRHHHPELPIIYWTGAPAESLPAIVHEDPLTRIVDKAGGAQAFEHALRWALCQRWRGDRG